jgi:hypothetical protein
VVVFPVAAMPHVFEFVTAFFGLPAVFAVLLNGDSQVLFCLVNISLTSMIVRPRGQ